MKTLSLNLTATQLTAIFNSESLSASGRAIVDALIASHFEETSGANEVNRNNNLANEISQTIREANLASGKIAAIRSLRDMSKRADVQAFYRSLGFQVDAGTWSGLGLADAKYIVEMQLDGYSHTSPSCNR